MNYLPAAGGQIPILRLAEVARKFAPKEGCFVEVGVFTGGTASYLTEIAENRNQKIYLYDTFSGLPYQDSSDMHPVGAFNYSDMEAIKAALPYAEVIKGLFPQSAVEMPKVAFAHIDVDQYQSYIECVNYLKPLMVEGGIMWFDDYELEGAKKAIHELFEEKDLFFTYPQPGVPKVFTIF
jgi:hypothetical protein